VSADLRQHVDYDITVAFFIVTGLTRAILSPFSATG